MRLLQLFSIVLKSSYVDQRGHEDFVSHKLYHCQFPFFKGIYYNYSLKFSYCIWDRKNWFSITFKKCKLMYYHVTQQSWIWNWNAVFNKLPVFNNIIIKVIFMQMLLICDSTPPNEADVDKNHFESGKYLQQGQNW